MSHPHAVSVAVWKDEESESSVTRTSATTQVPLNWKVLVQPNQVNMQTKGGLHLRSYFERQ